ncbi:MAG: DUF86 domain-containing protein [Armatimonadia bacterium]
MRDVRERLLDMQEAVERISKYTSEGRREFDENELVQTWVVHHLEIIGEAASAIPDDFRNSHQRVPWRQIVAMRHILIHQYFGIDTEAVWAVVSNDLPELRAQLETMLQE